MTEPRAPRTEWDEIAASKLARVVGGVAAEEVRLRVLGELGMVRLESVDDLYRFARALAQQGGFAGAVGGLLSVHAVMHGASGQSREVP
jgi:hypothetical protein